MVLGLRKTKKNTNIILKFHHQRKGGGVLLLTSALKNVLSPFKKARFSKPSG